MKALELYSELSLDQLQIPNLTETDVLLKLRYSEEKLLSIKVSDNTFELVFHNYISAIHELCIQIYYAEKAGCSKEKIMAGLDNVRNMITRSPLINRLHYWPRGYPGDFETIEWLYSAKNRATPGTLEYVSEMYTLLSPIVQQHRNKINQQANLVLNTVKRAKHQPSLLSIACGGCIDIENVQNYIAGDCFNIFLNDFDKTALAYASDRLKMISDKIHVLEGNIITSIKTISRHKPFDLIYAGGLFDYLHDRHIEFVLKYLFSFLKPGGTLFFTNIVKDDPYRIWREYFANWTLIGRSEQDILKLIQNAGIEAACANINTDDTGLSLFVYIKNPKSSELNGYKQ